MAAGDDTIKREDLDVREEISSSSDFGRSHDIAAAEGNASAKFANAAAKWGDWQFVVDFSTTKVDHPENGGIPIPASVEKGSGIYEIGVNKPKTNPMKGPSVVAYVGFSMKISNQLSKDFAFNSNVGVWLAKCLSQGLTVFVRTLKVEGKKESGAAWHKEVILDRLDYAWNTDDTGAEPRWVDPK